MVWIPVDEKCHVDGETRQRWCARGVPFDPSLNSTWWTVSFVKCHQPIKKRYKRLSSGLDRSRTSVFLEPVRSSRSSQVIKVIPGPIEIGQVGARTEGDQGDLPYTTS